MSLAGPGVHTPDGFIAHIYSSVTRASAISMYRFKSMYPCKRGLIDSNKQLPSLFLNDTKKTTKHRKAFLLFRKAKIIKQGSSQDPRRQVMTFCAPKQLCGQTRARGPQ